MSKTILGVIVRNKLGRTFGNREIKVKENDLETVTHSVSPGGHVPVPSTDEQVPLQSLEIKAMTPLHAAAESKIPIKIDSSGDYDISLKQDGSEPKWRIEFKSKVGRIRGSKDEEDPPVDVSVGQDEPPAPGPGMLLMMSIGLPAAWFLSPCLVEVGSVLWYVIPALPFIGGIVLWLSRMRKNKV